MDDSSDDEADGRQYALVTQEAAQVLETAGEGPLNQRLKHLADERNDLLDEVWIFVNICSFIVAKLL